MSPFYGALLLFASCALASASEQRLTTPTAGPIEVAFVVSDNVTPIDTAGRVQVFEDVPSSSSRTKYP
jgi:hypothetical protein